MRSEGAAATSNLIGYLLREFGRGGASHITLVGGGVDAFSSGMRRSKEIMVLLALLVGAMAFVLWYVIDRRAKNRAAAPVAIEGPAPHPPVDLTKVDGKTVDFSSGQPVVKDSPADQAAIDAALKEMAEATKGVTFGPAKPAEPAKK